ncbi:phosphoglycerate mutase-like protein isoform X5 [Cryptomeria japonica]|uniref:phosphoglycerate mutase-like protein isoform X5 n=1 Tax=Cryptomeria japonica TaxID=3369 RepID=UPI0025AB663E|nr:phosphoglycerate mutase-like protein isoform X5 [Cryptomeria japonica]
MLINYSARLHPQDMFETRNSSLYPLHRCKTLHIVRHAQGYHNVTGDIDRTVLLSHELADASLTPLGWQQVDILRKQVAIIGIASRVELVVTSPLTRTIQTAVGVFGGGYYNDSDPSPPLMVAGAGRSDRAAISSSKCPPFLAMELCRERMGLHPCDQRKSISECQTLFPAIDFSLVETDEDVLWKPDAREKEYDIAARGVAFLNCGISTSLRITDFPGYIPSCLNVSKDYDGVKNTEDEHALAFPPRTDVPIDCDDVKSTKKEFTAASK